MFGTFIKEKRLLADLSLREFCRQLGEDASNWSKIEREKLMPPRDEKKLEKIAVILKIHKGTEEWQTLVDLACVDSGSIPHYVQTDKEIMKALPIFFRTVGSVKPSYNELKELVEYLKKEG